jgi:hypothetical protein
MSTVTATPAPVGQPPARAPRASLWVLRVVAVLVTLLVLLQPLFAGLYLSGSYDMLRGHEVNALVLSLVGLGQLVAAIVFWARRGRGWPALLALVLVVAEQVQTGFGYARLLGVHIPLGVAIVVGQVLLTAWLLGRRARRPRRRLRRPRRRTRAEGTGS